MYDCNRYGIKYVYVQVLLNSYQNTRAQTVFLLCFPSRARFRDLGFTHPTWLPTMSDHDLCIFEIHGPLLADFSSVLRRVELLWGRLGFHGLGRGRRLNVAGAALDELGCGSIPFARDESTKDCGRAYSVTQETDRSGR